MTPLTLLYTHNLRGDLSLLPRLFAFLRVLRAQAQRFEDDEDVMQCLVQPPARRVLLVDVGGSCATDVWHCAATGGRSTLIVLDAMGYDAAQVTGQLAADARAKAAPTMQMALVDGDHAYHTNDVTIAAARALNTPAFQIVLQPGDTARLDGRALYPAALTAGQVGMAHISLAGGMPRLSGHEIHALPASTPPDATIAGTVEFVLSEARYYQSRRTE